MRDKGIADSDTYKEVIFIYANNNDSIHGIEALEHLTTIHPEWFSFNAHMRPLIVYLHRKKLTEICLNIWTLIKQFKVELDQNSLASLIAAVVQVN